MIQTGREHDSALKILETVDEVNHKQRRKFFEKILAHYNGDVAGITFAVWGLSFKPRTDDMREAPSIDIINWIREKGAKIRTYDPQAMEAAALVLNDDVVLCKTDYEALEGADALVLVTEWNDFREPDFDKIKELLSTPLIFDGRNIYSQEVLRERGFTYYSIGRK